MFNRGYEIAIRVLEEHIRKQDKVIEGLLKKLYGKDMQITQEEILPKPLEDDELDLHVPTQEDVFYPGSIINKDEQ